MVRLIPTHVINGADQISLWRHADHLNSDDLLSVLQPFRGPDQPTDTPHRQAAGVAQTQVLPVFRAGDAVGGVWKLKDQTLVT